MTKIESQTHATVTESSPETEEPEMKVFKAKRTGLSLGCQSLR